MSYDGLVCVHTKHLAQCLAENRRAMMNELLKMMIEEVTSWSTKGTAPSGFTHASIRGILKTHVTFIITF